MRTPAMNELDNERIQEIRIRIGTVLLGLGGVISVLVFVDRSGLDLLTMPAFWYRSRPLHLLLCIGFIFGGLLLLRVQSHGAGPDNVPRTDTGAPRPLFQNVRFYSRPNCPLCNEAMDILETFGEWMPEIEYVDITGDHQLEQKHGAWIPVIEMDGRVRFRAAVDPVLLQQLIISRRHEIDGLDQEPSS